MPLSSERDYWSQLKQKAYLGYYTLSVYSILYGVFSVVGLGSLLPDTFWEWAIWLTTCTLIASIVVVVWRELYFVPGANATISRVNRRLTKDPYLEKAFFFMRWFVITNLFFWALSDAFGLSGPDTIVGLILGSVLSISFLLVDYFTRRSEHKRITERISEITVVEREKAPINRATLYACPFVFGALLSLIYLQAMPVFDQTVHMEVATEVVMFSSVATVLSAAAAFFLRRFNHTNGQLILLLILALSSFAGSLFLVQAVLSLYVDSSRVFDIVAFVVALAFASTVFLASVYYTKRVFDFGKARIQAVEHPVSGPVVGRVLNLGAKVAKVCVRYLAFFFSILGELPTELLKVMKEQARTPRGWALMLSCGMVTSLTLLPGDAARDFWHGLFAVPVEDVGFCTSAMLLLTIAWVGVVMLRSTDKAWNEIVRKNPEMERGHVEGLDEEDDPGFPVASQTFRPQEPGSNNANDNGGSSGLSMEADNPMAHEDDQAVHDDSKDSSCYGCFAAFSRLW